MAEVKVLGKSALFCADQIGYTNLPPAHDFLAPKTESRELGQHRDSRGWMVNYFFLNGNS
jgi:hypothetical protein